MSELRKVGFFNELALLNENIGSIRCFIENNAHPNEAEILKYLTGAECLVATGTPTEDVLNPSAGLIGTAYIYTDGKFVWPLDLAYYLKTYHVSIPVEFVNYMRANEWKPPTLSKEILMGLSLD